MRNLAIILTTIFLIMVGVYFFIFAPEKYEEPDLYQEIQKRGVIKVGINTDSKPFAYTDSNGMLIGYDVDLAKYIAQYLLKNPDRVEFIPVTPSNRLIKASTGEVDIVISTVTITPQRQEVVSFSIPYDYAGQAILVKADSRIKSLSDLAEQSVGVIFGTTAEYNMKNFVPTANVIGFRKYSDAYEALKKGQINAITSDDTILNRCAFDDYSVKLLPKRYSREPYGIAFKKGNSTIRLKENLNYAITDLKQKNVIPRLRKRWGIL